MRGDVAELLAFDPSALVREAQERDARRAPEERRSAELALERARFEAADFLVDCGSPADARFAAAWFLGRVA